MQTPSQGKDNPHSLSELASLNALDLISHAHARLAALLDAPHDQPAKDAQELLRSRARTVLSARWIAVHRRGDPLSSEALELALALRSVGMSESEIARLLDCAPYALSYRRRTDPEYRLAWEACTEVALDPLLERIRDHVLTASMDDAATHRWATLLLRTMHPAHRERASTPVIVEAMGGNDVSPGAVRVRLSGGSGALPD